MWLWLCVASLRVHRWHRATYAPCKFDTRVRHVWSRYGLADTVASVVLLGLVGPAATVMWLLSQLLERVGLARVGPGVLDAALVAAEMTRWGYRSQVWAVGLVIVTDSVSAPEDVWHRIRRLLVVALGCVSAMAHALQPVWVTFRGMSTSADTFRGPLVCAEWIVLGSQAIGLDAAASSFANVPDRAWPHARMWIGGALLATVTHWEAHWMQALDSITPIIERAGAVAEVLATAVLLGAILRRLLLRGARRPAAAAAAATHSVPQTGVSNMPAHALAEGRQAFHPLPEPRRCAAFTDVLAAMTRRLPGLAATKRRPRGLAHWAFDSPRADSDAHVAAALREVLEPLPHCGAAFAGVGALVRAYMRAPSPLRLNAHEVAEHAAGWHLARPVGFDEYDPCGVPPYYELRDGAGQPVLLQLPLINVARRLTPAGVHDRLTKTVDADRLDRWYYDFTCCLHRVGVHHLATRRSQAEGMAVKARVLANLEWLAGRLRDYNVSPVASRRLLCAACSLPPVRTRVPGPFDEDRAIDSAEDAVLLTFAVRYVVSSNAAVYGPNRRGDNRPVGFLLTSLLPESCDALEVGDCGDGRIPCCIRAHARAVVSASAALCDDLTVMRF